MPQAPKRLLIVDDDSGLQSQLRWCFADYEVEVAGDRPSALEVLRAGDIGVVTLDLGLPPDPTNASEGLRALTEILAPAGLTPATLKGEGRYVEDVY